MTPQRSGMPTKPQARMSLRLLPSDEYLLAMTSLLPLGLCRCLGFARLHVVFLAHRIDEEIADEADHQQYRHDVHRDVVGLGLRHAMRDVVFADVVDEHRTE